MKAIYDFPVESVPLVTEDGLETRYEGVVRRDTNEVISVVSKDYQLVPHALVVNAVHDRLVRQGIQFREQFKTRGRGASLIGTIRITNRPVTIKDNDVLDPQLIVWNSYDKTRRVKFNVGFFRHVCMNGMVVGDSIYSVNALHLKSQIDINEFQNSINRIFSDLDSKIIPSYKQFVQKEISQEAFQAVVKRVRQRLYGKKKDDFSSYLAQRGVSQMKNAWQLYNVVTWYLTHRLKDQFARAAIMARFDSLIRRVA